MLGNEVYVSEFECPLEHEVVKEFNLVNRMNGEKMTEKLFYIVNG